MGGSIDRKERNVSNKNVDTSDTDLGYAQSNPAASQFLP
jgi:hypothetical protein